MNKYVDSLLDWDDFKKTLGLTQEEWDEIDLKNRLIGEIIDAREKQKITIQGE